MNEHELTLLRRKTILGTAAAICWALVALAVIVWPDIRDPVGPFFVIVSWLLTALWIALDASIRARQVYLWTVFSLAAAPLAVLAYVLTSPPTTAICNQCGNRLANMSQTCPICGARHVTGRVASAINHAYTSLADSLMRAPVEQAKNTTRAIAITLGIAALVGIILTGPGTPTSVLILAVLCVAGYWILVPWWVYLDASWRRMEPMPWAMLTLLTNVVGLVTYLVIRYPDPRACPKCGADLPVGLKRCPYCGSEAEPTCPRCQSPVRPDWVFCPSCASQLPVTGPQQAPETSLGATGKPPAISISGSVVDGATGLPLEGAEVKVDSRDMTAASMTDAVGRFLLAELDPRPYVLIASAKGYASQAKSFTPMAVGAGQCHFTLMPSRAQMEVKAEAET